MQNRLSRRERQIMEVVYERERASVQEVLGALPDPPSYSAVRALMRILEEKGHLRHEEEGSRYVYLPTQPRASVGESALKQVVRSFFGGSVAAATASLLNDRDRDLSDEELDQLEALIAQARRGEDR